MTGSNFDRIARTLTGRLPRRGALRAIAGGVAAALGRAGGDDAEAKKKKKRCLHRGKTCGGKKKCCDNSGLVKCQEFTIAAGNECFIVAGEPRLGFFCCGLPGAPCDPDFGVPSGAGPDTFGNCSCCQPGFCGKQPNGKFRCQTEDT